MPAATPDSATVVSPSAGRLRAAGEWFLLTLVAASPWAFGCVDPLPVLVLSLGVLVLLLLWAVEVGLSRRLSFTPDAVSVALLGLLLLTACQLLPLPVGLARLLSPETVRLHASLIPERPELLPGETDADVPGRESWVRLSLAPAATEDLLTRLLVLFLAYAAARNFVAPTASLRRLAWVTFGLGVGLSTLGLAQALSSPRDLIYWRFERFGQSYGPFGNKNHFAFQLYLPIGLSAGLLLAALRRPERWRSPVVFGLVGGLGLMLAALLDSRSRGAIVAGLAAAAITCLVALRVKARDPQLEGGVGGDDRFRRSQALPTPARSTPVLMTTGLAGLAVLAVAVGLIAWLGWAGVVGRLATVWSGEVDNRSEDWASVWPLVVRFPLVGVGGGALIHAEHLVRTRPNLGYDFNTLDNEYYEALVEGGWPRLALTVGLAVAAVATAVGAYRRHGSPLWLGCLFGLTAVVIHSGWDFGLHTPSVAVLAAVGAAYVSHARAAGRGDEPGGRGGSVGGGSAVLVTGRPALLLIGLLVAAGLIGVLADWRSYRVDRLRGWARELLTGDRPERYARAVPYLEAATRVRPGDPVVWSELAGARVATGDPRQLDAALQAARRARDGLPLLATPHLLLGRYADRFARSEPPAVHFERAKLVAGFDPLVWYVSGSAAADRGDWNTAAADWREALSRSTERLSDILLRCRDRLTPEELRLRLLPDDPAVWFAAAFVLYPEPTSPGRREWMRAVADRWAASEPDTPRGYADWAGAAAEAAGTPAAEAVWRRAVERFPAASGPRDGLAAVLEAEERYAEALPLLESLVAAHPDREDYRRRLAAARHALRLRAEIDGP